jgi:isopenicillin N synthase-like dioxygenase
MDDVFDLPEEEKLSMSFLKIPCRRGYEEQGMSHRVGDPLPDAKECFFIGQEDVAVEAAGFFGPNVWPSLPDSSFRTPAWEHYQKTRDLGKTIWTILIEGLGQPASLVDTFSKRPVVHMKMICYPPHSTAREGQLGIGAHTDLGGVTILAQQPGKRRPGSKARRQTGLDRSPGPRRRVRYSLWRYDSTVVGWRVQERETSRYQQDAGQEAELCDVLAW